MTNKTTEEILGVPGLDIIDDYMTDDDLLDHRAEILDRMRIVVNEINAAAVTIMIELYYEAAAPFRPLHHAPKSFALRTCDYHDILTDALVNLRNNGFFSDNETNA